MDRYKVISRVGVGTYGSAYLVCLKASPSEQFVLKKVKIDEDDEKEKQQAETEVTMLMQLSHPLILGYVDHFMYKGHLCIVTEYCEGGDLYQLLRARTAPLPEPQLLELFVQVLLAIQHVHSRSILHRDLKTQNIFLTRDGSIRLGDFGISRSLASTTDLASTIIGTPYYMSPEVMSSQPYDFKSDMWSLGCVLYEMMSLKHAFSASDMSSLVLKILRGEHLPVPMHFSAELRDLCKQLLSKSPRARPTPEMILKLSFLKDYIIRAKDIVARVDGQRALRLEGARFDARRFAVVPGSTADGSSGPPKPHRSSSASIPAAAAADDLSCKQLDRELEQAKERLRRIQAERSVLREQAQQLRYNVSSDAAPAPMLPPPVPRKSWSGAGAIAAPGAAGSPPVSNGGAPAAGALLPRGPSWKEGSGGSSAAQEDPGGRAAAHLWLGGGGQVMAPGYRPAAAGPTAVAVPGKPHIHHSHHGSASSLSSNAGAPVGGGAQAMSTSLSHLAGDVSVALEQHRERRHTRSSRPQSPEEPDGPPSPTHAGQASMDPKARREARKAEESRRREQELLNARKAYFEERKQAAAKQRQLWVSSADPISGFPTAAAYGSAAAVPPRRSSHSGLAQDFHGLSMAGDSDEDDRPSYGGHPANDRFRGDIAMAPSAGPASAMGALAEFEEELQRPGSAWQAPSFASPHAIEATFAGARTPLDRATAIREICVTNLGQPLFELLYFSVKQRLQAMGNVPQDGAIFRAELLQRLGPSRMQYVHLMDQLVYLESEAL